MIEIRRAVHLQDLEMVRTLFREYTSYLSTFIQPEQLSFDYRYAEIAALPGDAVSPGGGILLAIAGSEPAGCVVIGPMRLVSGEVTAEMRRMFVRPTFRCLGIGRRLIEHAICLAREAAYTSIYLENDPATMAAAAHLYRSFGFSETTPQSNDHTLRNAMFFRLLL